jgi:hypothetical protein
MNWITREHVKVDRVACPWLIKKFVDPNAEFHFVPAEWIVYGALYAYCQEMVSRGKADGAFRESI